MPAAKSPTAPEYFVYALEAEGNPFYVGIGRSKRASDRVRYVDYLMRREANGKTVKWVLSNRVVAHFLREGKDVSVRYLHRDITRSEALVLEVQEIKKLVSSGLALANIQHNSASIPRISYKS
jgi:hypothetical protein